MSGAEHSEPNLSPEELRTGVLLETGIPQVASKNIRQRENIDVSEAPFEAVWAVGATAIEYHLVFYDSDGNPLASDLVALGNSPNDIEPQNGYKNESVAQYVGVFALFAAYDIDET